MTPSTGTALPEWPGRDFNKSDYHYHNARVAFWESRCRLAVEALQTLADQDSGKVGSTARSDCMAVWARDTLRSIGPLPENQP